MKSPNLVLVSLLFLSTGAVLAADTPKFKVFGAAAYVSPLREEDVTIDAVEDSIKASDELGWNVGLEFRFNKVIGLEFDYINATNDIEFGGDVVGDVHMQPLSATLNFHLIPTSIVDLYLGPTASYFIWDDVDLGSAG